MKQTCNMLKTLFWLMLMPTAVLYVGSEFMDLDLAFLSEAGEQTRYIVATAMILLTLLVMPLSLRLFKIGKVHDDLMRRRSLALGKWGALRLSMLSGLLFCNTLLYYALGFETAFGYLAVVVLLALPFVYPTLNRCLSETEVQTEESAE